MLLRPSTKRCATWIRVVSLLTLLSLTTIATTVFSQAGTNVLTIFKNYFVTGDYVVAGWVEGSSANGYASGNITIPDTRQPAQNGVPAAVPNGATIVAAYLYWATVEGSQTMFAGQHGFFNGYPVTGIVLGNPKAPVSWSSGGCSGSAQGSKTMRTYRADVRPYMPVDGNPSSPTYGQIVVNGTIPVRLADSGSNGYTQPNALGATLVIIYRVLTPTVPLNSIVLYDGAYAPSNTSQNTSQTMVGFYQPATSPVAKLTHIVANGQTNKSEQVYLNNTSQPLPSLYGTLPPFPGIYGTWDNPTWVLSQYGYVSNTDTSETALITPSNSNSGCVSWGAMILSTTVQDTDEDGLLDVWEGPAQGYTDAVSGQFVPLPGANPNVKDLFVEVDYLNNLDGSAGANLHSHLPRQAALDAVGNTFAAQGVNVHFDVGSAYQGLNDPYIIPGGTGGNAISEGLVVCTDGAALCAFPNQPAVGWKAGFEFVQAQPALGNFQPGRSQSYHYVLFGHSLGASRSFWNTYGSVLGDSTIPQVISIVNSGSAAVVTIQSPQGVLKPGDCPNPLIKACSDANSNRITITGALSQSALNGTYLFSNAHSSTVNNIATTTFTIKTANVANGTYTYSNEPQLGVAYLGPTSTSGHSEFGGGGDSAVTLGLWGFDDAANCQPDPSQPLTSGQAYCNNQVGTTAVQTGTLLHELGHSLTLTHGGAYYNDSNNPSLATYDLNCKPNFVSVMNYLFQTRGFVDGGFDYSAQTMPALNEAYPYLDESVGIGTDMFTGSPATHLTRWYSAPNAADVRLQNTTGGRFAAVHCDGTPLLPNEPAAVRVDGFVGAGGDFSAPLDWNNDLLEPDSVFSPGEDLNHDGIVGDPAFLGFNDWQVVTGSDAVALQQTAARAPAFGFSAASGLKFGTGGEDNDGGGLKFGTGGLKFGSGGLKFGTGGTDQDEDTATSTADPPTGLVCSNCVFSSGSLLENGKSVPLSWTAPGFGQIRKYYVWRAVGSFPTAPQVLANFSKFSVIKTLTGTPPATIYTDSTVKNSTTYTYVVSDANKQGAQSGPSNPIVVTTKF